MIEIEANRNMLFDYNNYSTDLNFRKDKFTRGVFEGVYHADKLAASIPKLSARYIANVDRSEKPGSSWVAFYLTKSKRENDFIVMDHLRAIIKNNDSGR